MQLVHCLYNELSGWMNITTIAILIRMSHHSPTVTRNDDATRSRIDQQLAHRMWSEAAAQQVGQVHDG